MGADFANGGSSGGSGAWSALGSLPLLDYGARMFLTRGFPQFTGPDPFSEMYRSTSLYAYCLNNPIRFIDVEGLFVTEPQGLIFDPYQLGDKDYRRALMHESLELLSLTDLDDAIVVGSTLLSMIPGSGFEPVHLNGESASNGDIEAAKMGLIVPVVSGGAVKKAGDALDAGLRGGSKLPNSKIKEAPAKRGNAPIGDDGSPIELHHRNQTPDGPIDEMTKTDHRIGDNYKANHPNTGQDKSLIDRNEFGKERKQYWENQWDGGRFSGSDKK